MFLNIIFLFASVFGLQADTTPPQLYKKYKEMLVGIRNYYITPQEAATEFQSIMAELREAYGNELKETDELTLTFPLVGSNVRAVGGRNGNGFRAKNFDLFDQNVSGSHPAHDIFIYDRNQDDIDDAKGTYIDVVSVGHGIVIAVESDWQEGSIFKGGNYVWVYDTERGGLWYYAHNRISVVVAGQRVKPGDKLGEVGRTGFNAARNRSDTHLHLMYLDLDVDLLPIPFNYYEWLKEANTIYESTVAEPFTPRKEFKKIESTPLKIKNINLRKKVSLN